MYPYLNFHTHLKHVSVNTDPGSLCLYSLDLLTESIPSESPQLMSVAYHPMSLMLEHDLDTAARRLEKVLKRNPSIYAIGELGWDKRSTISMELQDQWVKMQVELAERFQKPLVFHIVGAWHRLLGLRASLGGKAKQAWIVHGFRGKAALLEQVQKAGIIVSLQKVPQEEQSILLLKKGSFFLETDDSEENIKEVYHRFAGALGEDESGLKRKIWETFLRMSTFSTTFVTR